MRHSGNAYNGVGYGQPQVPYMPPYVYQQQQPDMGLPSQLPLNPQVAGGAGQGPMQPQGPLPPQVLLPPQSPLPPQVLFPPSQKDQSPNAPQQPQQPNQGMPYYISYGYPQPNQPAVWQPTQEQAQQHLEQPTQTSQQPMQESTAKQPPVIGTETVLPTTAPGQLEGNINSAEREVLPAWAPESAACVLESETEQWSGWNPYPSRIRWESLFEDLEDWGWCFICGEFGHKVGLCPHQEGEELPAQKWKRGGRALRQTLEPAPSPLPQREMLPAQLQGREKPLQAPALSRAPAKGVSRDQERRRSPVQPPVPQQALALSRAPAKGARPPDCTAPLPDCPALPPDCPEPPTDCPALPTDCPVPLPDCTSPPPDCLEPPPDCPAPPLDFTEPPPDSPAPPSDCLEPPPDCTTPSLLSCSLQAPEGPTPPLALLLPPLSLLECTAPPTALPPLVKEPRWSKSH
ncbi:hypothetical protein EOD39_3899 [Acipenser ruthenus]|uniref:Uncharacterized protein n=1 Tax=Acipenser ruthenus TaxID=7906 RepID=A0A662YYY2_ACIRT|nr:hypothetical protein EOD39_3899 [Acipenser ruthenus]